MPDKDYITPLKNEIRNSISEIEKSVANIEKTISTSTNNIIAAKEKSTDKVIKKEKDARKERNEEYLETVDEANAETKSTWQQIGEKAKEYGKSLLSDYERMLRMYSEDQQRLTFNLIGSGLEYSDIKSAMAILSTNAFVKQEKVYSNLSELVRQGITMNVAQRAFLKTTAEQVGIQFNAVGELNRLILLQREDLSESRLAQMAGLKTFLEQNYQTSQYINDGFNNVSNRLVEMQSMMTSSMAMATEKTIQTYLGAFQSSGATTNTVGNIADALGKIGSGDFSGLSEGMQNLMVMAASRAGLSYADLLTGGLNEADTQKLMTNLFAYIASMSDIGGGSNVAMNAIAKIFGVSVSDIKAAQNSNYANIKTDYFTDNISQFLGNIAESTNAATAVSNVFSNLMSAGAMRDDLLRYTLIKDLSPIIGGALKSAGEAQGVAGGQLLSLLGSGIEALPILNVLANVGMAAGQSGALNDLFSIDTLKALAGKGKSGTGRAGVGGLVDEFMAAFGWNAGGLYNDYLALGGELSQKSGFNSSGSFGGSTGGQTSSGKVTNEEYDRATVSITSDEEEEGHSFEDLYNLLADDFPTTTFSTIANIPSAESGNNSILIGSAETTKYITDMLTITAVSTENIWMLLEMVFDQSKSYTLTDMTSIGIDTWGDWSGTGTGGTR